MAKNSISKISNAFSTGGGGVNFEQQIQAMFLLSLLIDGFCPAMNEQTKKVHFQAKHLGHDVDDLVVITYRNQSEGKMACQIKHSITATEKDKTFQEVICAAWNDFNKEDFDRDRDRIALVTAQISNKAQQSLRFLHVEKLVACKRYATAVNIIGHSECEAVINAECIYKLMKLAGTEESIGVETLDDYAAQKIIGWFQQQEDIDLELRSDIEFIYLPMLDEYSEVRPRALNTRLSLEPEYFCSLIELFYKERNGEKREIELNKSLSDRLYEILFQFKVIPGIDWNGNFDAKRFDYWMKTVKTWSRDNDRYEVAMHTVGSGLSYAELDEDKLPQTAIIEELNRVENEELRRGYYLGIINQRGVHWIDPEGKPELELAEDYENRANTAESRGYSRYAGILRVIGDEFKREARRNALRARNENDDIE